MQKTMILFYCLTFLCVACKQQKKIANPAGYDLASPELLKMPPSLNEISGITFKNGQPDTIYAEQDEEGKLFYFPPSTMDVKHIKFGKKGDYEDIAICKDKVIILRSDGTLFLFPFTDIAQGEAVHVQEFADVLPKGEYEGMYADEDAGLIYVLCKECRDDNPSKSITGYIFKNDSSGPKMESTFQINTREIAAMLGEKKITFRPSAFAKNKQTGEWYIVSSINKLLVIADANWKATQVFKLDATMFYQPEGIAFDNQHNLYISNERGIFQNATILKFGFHNENP